MIVHPVAQSLEEKVSSENRGAYQPCFRWERRAYKRVLSMG
jgi:hypothetical protein